MFIIDGDCKNCKLTLKATIEDAISLLEKGKLKIVLIIDENNTLKGVVYDGDIRRALLKGLNLSSRIEKAMVSNYIRATKSTTNNEILKIMKENQISHVPVVNNENNFLGLHVLENPSLEKSFELPNSVLLMAGGRGKRLIPLTDNCPKPMLKINGKPMLEIIIEQCIEAGLRNFYISVYYLSDQIIDYFGNGEKWDIKISYIKETKPLGTAGALSLLPKNINHPLLIMNGDILTKINLLQFFNFHTNNKAEISLSGSEYYYQSPYGVIDVDGINFKSITEKPTFKHFINAGIYIVNPETIKGIDSNEYLDMPDLLNKRLEKKFKVVVYPIYEYWLDIGKVDSLNKARLEWD